MVTAEEIIAKFNLVAHPKEGGYFTETYRSVEKFDEEKLPCRYESERNVSTAIYYLLTEHSISLMHRLKSDEVFHFYLGDEMEMLHLFEDGTSQTVRFGDDIKSGALPQVVVPRNVWQGARLKPGGRFALIGCTVAPGFDYQDYEHGQRGDLIQRFPKQKDLIEALTE